MSPRPPVISLQAIGVIDYRADLVTVTTATALPPGSRVSLAIPTLVVDDHGGVIGKIVGVKRDTSETYTIRVRLHSLSKAARAALARLVTPHRPPPGA